ncbi:LMBR1 domain-containing protein 2-like protein A, partial [Bienertia sinuspersici]
KYISSLRGSRPGTIGSFLDTIELLWCCILRKQLQKLLAIILGCMSVAILLAEATLLPSVDLSLFSILIKSVGRQELMVARYAPPISYNFLNLIRLDDNAKTIFEMRMGNIDDAVPFFGKKFNKIYPLIMVIYTILVASNFFDRMMDFFGSWKRLKIQSEAEDLDGFDPSGMIILQKERSWLEQGHKVGEQVIPLARNFNNVSMDVESGTNKDEHAVEMKGFSSTDDIKGGKRKTSKCEARLYSGNREAISQKYALIREQNKQTSSSKPAENTIASAKVSLLNTGTSEPANDLGRTSSGMSSTWHSMKLGFQNLKTNLGSKKFLPLRELQETKLLSDGSSSESLDEIFQRLKRPSSDSTSYVDADEDDDDREIKKLGSKR